MSLETLQICTRNAKKMYTVVTDLNDGTTNVLKEGGITFSAPAITALMVQAADAEGNNAVGSTIPNGTITVNLWVNGSDQYDLTRKLSTAISTAYQTGYFLKWQPYGVGLPVYYEIVAPSSHDVPYSWHEYAKNRSSLTLTFQVKPFAEGDCMTTWDDFSTDTISGGLYTQQASGGAGTLSVSNGTVIASSATPDYRLWNTGKGYEPQDVQVTAHFHTSSNITGQAMAVGARRSDDGQKWIEANWGSTTMSIRYTTNGGGTMTVLASTGVSVATTNTDYWMRLRIVGTGAGTLVCAERWTSQPSSGSNPTNVVVYVLTSGDAANIQTTGSAGVSRWNTGGATTNAYFDDLWVEPYTYGFPNDQVGSVNMDTVLLPAQISLPSIPGDYPAKVDLALAHLSQVTGASKRPAWGLVSWAQPNRSYLPGYNLCSNGDFETDTAGWDTQNFSAFTGGLTASASTLTVDATHAVSGTKALKFVGTAAVGRGVEFQVFRRFRKGVTYTFQAQVWSASGGTVTPFLGAGSGGLGGADFVTGTPVSNSSAFNLVTVAWTPTADYDEVWVALKFSAASTTAWIDSVAVYEGTSLVSQTPDSIIPFGEIPAGWMAAQYDPAMGTNLLTGTWGLQNDSTAAASRFHQYIGYSGDAAATASASLTFDPSSIPADWYAIFARVKMGTVASGLYSIVASVTDQYGNGQPMYTAEYGSTGKSLVAANGANFWRKEYVGSLFLGSTEQSAQRLTLTFNTNTFAGIGNFGFDSIEIVPMRQLLARRWDTGGLAADGFVPFHNSFQGESVIRSSLRQTMINQATMVPYDQGYPNTGMIGAPLLLPTGNTRVFVDLTNVVPGDTDLASTTNDTPIYNAQLRFIVTPRYRFARGS